MNGPMIQIGGSVENTNNVGENILSILKVGRESGSDQETIRAALHALTQLTQTKNVSITNSMFVGEKHESYVLDLEPLDESDNEPSD